MKTEVVILTTEATGTPWLEAIQETNPELVIHVRSAAAPGSPEELRMNWRNCDRNIRDWWKENAAVCTADAVLFLEWDVWANVDLTSGLDALLDGKVGMLAPSVMTPLRGGRSFQPFQEVNRLPMGVRHLALAVVPLAVVALSRAALDALAAEALDGVYAEDIFSELRLPTMVRASGFEVRANPAWKQVVTTPLQPTGDGIFHPVKTTIE